MTKLRWIAATVLLGSTAWALPARAQGVDGLTPSPDEPPTRQGTRGANFLHLGIGARGNAMAGAVSGTIDGPSAWFWNPAGAATAEGFSLAAGRQNLYGDLGVKQSYVGVAMPLLGGVIGISLNTLNSGNIERTSQNQPIGDAAAGRFFDWNSTAAGLGYARRLTDRLALGGQLKFITEGITDAKTDWIAADFGTQFNTGIYGLVLAASLQQVGSQGNASGAAISQVINNANINDQSTRVNLDTKKTDLPTAFRFALGSDLLGTASSLLGQRGGGSHRLYAEVAINDAVDLASQLAFGGEYSFRNFAFVRGGKKFYNDDRAVGGSKGMYGLSGGLGLRVPVAGRAMRFDYSFTSLGDLKDIQVFSFEFGR
ncbi:MAG TPA: PorV/PorQ family protein [Burkholderiaceae bacterium]|nr:PorV/PorQ family protein [Burkholderiaceae bacterium]